MRTMNYRRLVVLVVVMFAVVTVTASGVSANHDDVFPPGDTYVHQVKTVNTAGSAQTCVSQVDPHIYKVTINETTHFDTKFWKLGSPETSVIVPKLEVEKIVLYSNGDNALIRELAEGGRTCTTEDLDCSIVLHEYYIRTTPTLTTDQGVTVETGENVFGDVPSPTNDAAAKAQECGIAATTGTGTLGSSGPGLPDHDTQEVQDPAVLGPEPDGDQAPDQGPDGSDHVDDTTDTVNETTDDIGRTYDRLQSLVNETVAGVENTTSTTDTDEPLATPTVGSPSGPTSTAAGLTGTVGGIGAVGFLLSLALLTRRDR